mgnify:FL=1
MTKLFTVVSIESEFGRQIYTDLVHAESKHDAFTLVALKRHSDLIICVEGDVDQSETALMAGYDLVACDDWLNGSVPLTEPQAIALIEEFKTLGFWFVEEDGGFGWVGQDGSEGGENYGSLLQAMKECISDNGLDLTVGNETPVPTSEPVNEVPATTSESVVADKLYTVISIDNDTGFTNADRVVAASTDAAFTLVSMQRRSVDLVICVDGMLVEDQNCAYAGDGSVDSDTWLGLSEHDQATLDMVQALLEKEGVILTELDDGKFVCHPSDEEPYEEAAYESRAKALADGVFNYDIDLLEV